jgi:hypothetical protein
VSDIDTVAVDSLKALDPKRPIREADIAQYSRHVHFVPIVLKKSFSGEERKFLGPLIRFARGDVRVHIISYKNDYRSSYRP